MTKDSGRSGGQAQPTESRWYWQYDLLGSKSRIGSKLLLLALMAMLMLATGQGAWVNVGACDTPISAYGVALSGSYAYVADYNSGLQIIDISNPASPSIVGTYNTPGFAYNVAISGSYAYVADGGSGLQIIDISNPASPSIVGTYNTPHHANGVAISSSYAYVADTGSGLQIIDISNPARPTLVGTYDTPGFATGVAISGSYAYVADDSSGLQIIDISNPASPSIVGTYNTPGYASDVAISSSYAYAADDSSGLQVIDVSNPARPTLVGTYDTRGFAIGVAISGSYAYVADGDWGLQIIDVSNPARRTLVGTYNTPGSANDVAISGSYAYVADKDSGLQIIAEGATLRGKTWHDQDGDGLRDAGEPGLPNVAVQLLDGSANPIASKSTTTGGDGRYSFIDLVPGDYYVQFTQPSGETISPKDQGADDSLDSDVDYKGLSDKITLDPGQSKSVDAGFYENQIIINEIYPNPVGSDNQASAGVAGWERVELMNVGTAAFNVGQWTIKDDDSPYILATIPFGTTIAPGGYLVVHIRGSSGGSISNGNGDPVILSNSDGVEMDRVDCPASSNKEGLSYSCIPDASDDWGFWGEPTFGGPLSSDSLPGAPNMGLDYGDAPNTFKTLRSSDGARHFVTGPYLGSSVDYESDGQPSVGADGDGSDEDGAVFSSIIVGTTSTFTVTASASGVLQAWMDFNGDGDFEDTGEHIASDQSLTAGEKTLDFSVPADAQAGDTYARLRISSASGLASYGLASNGEVEDYKVKITPRYTLGDYVWVDKNGNGIQDADETGLEGVTVNLRDSDNNIVSIQTSTDDGEFTFENPVPGTYNLEFSPPAGYSITSKDAGTDDELDSDADPVTHLAGPITMELGLSDNIWDAGFYQPVSISGMKFHDKNANSQKEDDEPGLSGWDIQLKDESDNLLQTTTTSSEPGKEGTYEFVDLQPGTYRVYEVQQDGWVRTAPAEEYYTVTLTNMPSRGNNFGNNMLAISGLKFHDKNANVQRDADEPPLSGWDIQLKDDSEKLLQTVTTSSEPGKEGTYEFIDLQPGNYRVYEVQQDGWVRTAPAEEYYTVTLTNMPSRGNSFGNNMLAISGMMFHDKNANGQRDADEPPISGWDIQLKDDSEKLLQTVATSFEPGKEGTYEFVDLQPGTYRVYEAQRNGWVRTAPAEEYYTVTLTNMPSRGNIFGNNMLAISGMKFHDKNANGQRDADEPPISGWDIQLKDDSEKLLQTVATSFEPGKEGTYEFIDLQPGTYRVYEVKKNGWARTAPAEECHTITLTNMPSRENLFGNVIASGFSGMKFEDSNGNGVKDSGESGLAGWTIRLKKEGTEVASTQTAAGGAYSFVDIAPGSYIVEEEVLAGWTQSYPASGTYAFELVSGIAGPTNIDFGNWRASGFSGMKFEDLNGNGAKDGGEPGLAGWTIRLMKEGTEVDRTQTATDGTYSFSGVAPGSYTVEEEVLAGWTQSYPATPGTHAITLVSGVAGPINIDFGNYWSTGLSGMKFDDRNGNGARDSNEPGLAGWTIRLMNGATEVAKTVTDADGGYSFADIVPGSYTVEETAQAGWLQTYPASPGTHSVTLVSGVAGPDNIDFGNWKTTGFSGMKFEDSNANNAKDGGEPGLSGWTIRLMNGATEVAKTVTGADGSYSFAGVAPGSYTVEEVAQAGWTQSYPASPGTHAITLVSGVDGPKDVDFGNWRKTSLSGMKFEDINGNGVKDAGEPSLSGWTVVLKKDGKQAASPVVTDADGGYSFADIVPGSYTVEEVAQDGWLQTCPASPGIYSLDLLSGIAATNIDFGNFKAGGFAGIKFEDKNGNGVRDSGEPGLPGWTIVLNKDGAEVASTVTASDGAYYFADIAPGSYTVKEMAQAGWKETSPADDIYTAVSSSGQVKITANKSEVAATEVDFGNRKLVEAFQVEIVADHQTVLPGESLVFTITINRVGDILLDSLSVQYTLPDGLKFVSANPSPQSIIENLDGSTTLIWTDLSFISQIAAQLASSQAESASPKDPSAPSTTITITSTVQSDAPPVLTGTVEVEGSTIEADVAKAEDTVTVNVPTQHIYLNKTSDLKEVWPGATIGYTITYENLVNLPLTQVTITEQASSDLIFLSAKPAPDQGTDNVWSIGDLPANEKGTINVFFQVKNTTNLSFYSQSSVSGSGFVSSYRRLSTETESQGLKNSVTLTCKEFTPVSTSYFVKLRDSDGTSLLEKEHGSGEYRSEEVAALQMQNRSISTEGSLKAVYRPTSFSLPGGKSINYSSEISTSTLTRNRATQASISQEIRYAKSLEMDQMLLVDKNETLILVEGSMQGQAHLGVLKKDGTLVKPSPIFESSQDYTGTFRFNQSLQDYGGNVRLIGNASGLGQAASDQRLKKSQRSYEHGSGSYENEEQASTAESYLAKDLSVSSDPGYGYGKWQSGIWSKSSGKSYLGQEISGADYINEETKASGLNDLSSNLSYRGQGRFRAVSEPDNRSMVDLDEEYVGEYSLQRKVHLGGTSRFDRPHLTLNKTGRLVPGTIVADYTIFVQNDGNTALGPVYVWDVFPAGTDYLSSSLKPNRLLPGYANWSLLYLGIGQSVTISLRLNLTNPQDELVNLAYASGGHNDEWVTAGNMSVMQFGWLGCCQPDIFLEKQARIDAVDSRLIWYRILLQNRANVSLVAQVRDRLPTGLRILNTSAEPQVEGLDLVWVTTAIPAGESRFIEYRAQATQNGKFVNTARAEAHALDGSGGATAAASATVTVGEATSYAEDGWRPPEWGLDRSEVICDDEIAGEGGSCSSCPSCSCAAEGF